MSPRVRLILILVFVYSLSPIDAIPDFLPGLGSLDDALVSALGIWFAARKGGGSPPQSP